MSFLDRCIYMILICRLCSVEVTESTCTKTLHSAFMTHSDALHEHFRKVMLENL